MGQTFEFTCGACAYKACVSGGPDRGFTTLTATVICLDCKELVDVTTGELAAGPGGTDIKRNAACEVNPKHKVKRWRSGGPCPRCGATMVRGDPVCLWD